MKHQNQTFTNNGSFGIYTNLTNYLPNKINDNSNKNKFSKTNSAILNGFMKI